uniref:Uncharacterized protein n=1 Tax=Physcomitrium patens TaxID=3218 RepID=A0A2K1II00_PHYPA|nr:hypothetical protein PHYPA_027598 [Physcomitrium patens]
MWALHLELNVPAPKDPTAGYVRNNPIFTAGAAAGLLDACRSMSCVSKDCFGTHWLSMGSHYEKCRASNIDKRRCGILVLMVVLQLDVRRTAIDLV